MSIAGWKYKVEKVRGHHLLAVSYLSAQHLHLLLLSMIIEVSWRSTYKRFMLDIKILKSFHENISRARKCKKKESDLIVDCGISFIHIESIARQKLFDSFGASNNRRTEVCDPVSMRLIKNDIYIFHYTDMKIIVSIKWRLYIYSKYFKYRSSDNP